MKKNLRKTQGISILLLCLMVNLLSCKDDDHGSSYNPSAPVEITKLDPEEGGAGTQCLIYGKNFGTDLSQIEVTFNGKKATVINSSGDCVYCFVPVRAGSGPVKVAIGKGEQAQECTAANEFKYESITKVNTLVGWMDKDHQSEIVDGNFEKAGFSNPLWIERDKQTGDLIVLDDRKALRRVNLRERKVETLFYMPQTLAQVRQLSFSPSCDTLFINNDQGSDTGVCTAIALRKEDFRTPHPLIEAPSSTGGACHPIYKDYYFNKWNHGGFYQWDFEKGTKKYLNEKGEETTEGPNATVMVRVRDMIVSKIIFAPSGEFAYIILEDNIIYKCDFNAETHRLENLQALCGQYRSQGTEFADGFGTSARFTSLQQGCFDEENNFYVCDQGNYCIRKIEPSGRVTTFAGRPGEWGYADGELRKEAMLNRPHGIAYDPENEIFYIADKENRCIRTIQEQ